jgi:hypothetical protein
MFFFYQIKILPVEVFANKLLINESDGAEAEDADTDIAL